MSFDAWTDQLKEYMDARTETMPSPATKHLFHLTVGDPGFWCQLGTFLVAGVVFRRLGFGDGPHNSWMLDLATFSIGWYLAVLLAGQIPVYRPRELAGSALGYAQSNFPERMVIVPFTSTFVPLLFGYRTASVENIAACWVQHFVALAFSHWSLNPKIVNQEADMRKTPYAHAARVCEELRVRLAVRGPFHDASRGSIERFYAGRATKEPAAAPEPEDPDMPALEEERPYRPETKPNRTEVAHMFFGPWDGHTIPEQVRSRLDRLTDEAVRSSQVRGFTMTELREMVAAAPRPR